MKKILIINGHPNSDSFNYAIANAYIKGAKSQNAEIKQINIAELDFGKAFLTDSNENQNVSNDLVTAQESIKWAEHLVWIYPIWWYSMPAMMKSFIELTFVSGFAFKYKASTNKVNWDMFLQNKSARLISTMDAPPWYYKLFIKEPSYKTMKGILNFCGIKPVKRTYFGSVELSDTTKREEWLKKVEELGKKLN